MKICIPFYFLALMDNLCLTFCTFLQSPFNQLRQQMSDVLGDGGILKEVVQAGDGPPVPHNASVLSIAKEIVL